jgi:hypothetical protein
MVTSSSSMGTGHGQLTVTASAASLVSPGQRLWRLVRAVVGGGLGGMARVLRMLLSRVPWVGQWRALRRLDNTGASSSTGAAGMAPVLLPAPPRLLADQQQQQQQEAGEDAPGSAAPALLVLPLRVAAVPAATGSHSSSSAGAAATAAPSASERSMQVSTSRAQPVLPPRRARHPAASAGAGTSTSGSGTGSGAASFSRPRSNAFVGQLPSGVGATSAGQVPGGGLGAPTFGATSRTAHVGLYGMSPSYAATSGSSRSAGGSGWVGVLPGVSGLLADGTFMQQLLEGLPGVDPSAAVVAASLSQIRGGPPMTYVAA